MNSLACSRHYAPRLGNSILTQVLLAKAVMFDLQQTPMIQNYHANRSKKLRDAPSRGMVCTNTDIVQVLRWYTDSTPIRGKVFSSFPQFDEKNAEDSSQMKTVAAALQLIFPGITEKRHTL